MRKFPYFCEKETDTMKILKVPFVENPEETDLDSLVETRGARFLIDTVNWPDKFPYAPIAGGSILRTPDSFIVDFRVSGLDLRVQNLEDNGSQWEDSCVEMFVQSPSGTDYFNFEINPLGKILSAAGPDRHQRVKRSLEELSEIIRIHSVTSNKPINYEGGIHSWRVTLCIPLELLGIDPENVPCEIRANFYKCGDLTAHPHFVTWSPVETPNPDFHRPEFFGKLILK